ncbi:MAG: glycosyltransferase family 9 protein [Lentisphaeria bacterium]|nr:glycosyltransferase family 9 protein [Lentisphaeria bacterium]
MNLSLACKADRILGSIGYLFLRLFRKKNVLAKPEEVKTVAVVKFLGGGSLTLAAPAVLALKQRFPAARFLLLTTPEVRPNAELLGIYDEIFLFSPQRPFAALKTLFQLKHLLCSTASILIDLELYSRFTHILTAWLSASRSIGLAQPGEKCLWDETIYVGKDVYMYDAYDRAARLAGAEVLPEHPQQFRVSGTAEKEKTLIAAPFCSALSLRREWDLDKWGCFLEEFSALHEEFSIIILGAPSDRERGEQLRQMLSASRRNRAENWCGKANFQTAFNAIRRSALFVGIDSAPLHLARLSGTPAVSLWGATEPRSLARPFKDYPEILLCAGRNCTPCVHKDSLPCPCNPSCTAHISCAEVLRSVEELLAGKITSSCFITPDTTEN